MITLTISESDKVPTGIITARVKSWNVAPGVVPSSYTYFRIRSGQGYIIGVPPGTAEKLVKEKNAEKLRKTVASLIIPEMQAAQAGMPSPGKMILLMQSGDSISQVTQSSPGMGKKAGISGFLAPTLAGAGAGIIGTGAANLAAGRDLTEGMGTSALLGGATGGLFHGVGRLSSLGGQAAQSANKGVVSTAGKIAPAGTTGIKNVAKSIKPTAAPTPAAPAPARASGDVFAGPAAPRTVQQKTIGSMGGIPGPAAVPQGTGAVRGDVFAGPAAGPAPKSRAESRLGRYIEAPASTTARAPEIRAAASAPTAPPVTAAPSAPPQRKGRETPEQRSERYRAEGKPRSRKEEKQLERMLGRDWKTAPIPDVLTPLGQVAKKASGRYRFSIFSKLASELSTKARNRLGEGEFALPGRRYPIHDRPHARNALARVAQHGTASEQSQVRKAVHARFPDVGEEKKAASPSSKTDWQRATPLEKGFLLSSLGANLGALGMRTADLIHDMRGKGPLFRERTMMLPHAVALASLGAGLGLRHLRHRAEKKAGMPFLEQDRPEKVKANLPRSQA